jgi:hypothetical protein
VAVAVHTRPRTVVPAPVAAAQAKAVEVRSEPLLFGLTSSRRHYEEQCRAEIQRQEGAPVTFRQMRAGADPARSVYTFSGDCLAFTDDLCHET